jgi:hypothetical protein
MSEPGQARQQHIDSNGLNPYLDDAVLPAERVRIDDHLATCANCRRHLAELRMVRDLLHALPQYDPPVSFRLGEEHARRAPAPPASRLLRFLPAVRALAVAAVICFLAVNGALIVDRTGLGESSGSEQPSPMVASTPTMATSADESGTNRTGQTSEPTEEAADQERMGALSRSSGQTPSAPIEGGGAASSSGGTPGQPASSSDSAVSTAVPERSVSTPESIDHQDLQLAVQPVGALNGGSDTHETLLVIAAIALGALSAIFIALWALLARTGNRLRSR